MDKKQVESVVVWVGVAVIVLLNVWQTIEILELRRQVYSQPQLAPAESELTVYRTRTGKKYHLGNCEWLKYSRIPISLAEAKKNMIRVGFAIRHKWEMVNL